jgi:predicted DNA-binding transcriptional regulator AlpA
MLTLPRYLLTRPDAVLTVRDLLAVLPYSRATFYRRIRDGRFPAGRKIGHAVVWTVEDVRHLL